MSEKKIEPTDAMVASAHSAAVGRLMTDPMTYRRILRAALNHPDAAELFADEDTIRAAREQGWDQAVDWIDSYQGGPNGRTSSARSANPYRPAPDLPTEDGAVIVPADGCEYIETRVHNKTYRAREAVRHWTGGWHAAWRSGPEVRGVVAPEEITPSTWKVDGQ